MTLAATAYAADIQRMDPPFWYAGMKNHELQVMLYGKDISRADFSLKKYPGVTVKEVAKVNNPNYLFVYLEVGEKARPGTLTFQFKEGRNVTEKTFELRPRNTKTGAQGFSSKDVLYLIMPDRFANGNPANDDWEQFKADRRNGGGHHGGDLQGIREHLGYIDSLGVTAIWLNPVQYNRSQASHGYAISDYYLIEPRLGSNEEYCELVDAAHGRNIKVVMDMIFNHSGSTHWWIEDIPDDDWFNQNDYARKLSERQRQGSPEGGFRRGPRGNDGLTTTTHYKWVLMDPHAPQSEKDILLDGWFSGGMPDLNQRNRHLAAYLIQNSIWWIEYARIDGIRMDTYPYADYDFMVRWCKEIEDEYPDFNIVGEGWYPRNSAAGWWQGGSALNPSDTHLKTVMDFDLTFTLQREILKESNTGEGSEAGLFKIYEAVTQDFLIPDPDHVLTFLDNHDISRFMQPGDPVWKFKQGLAFLLTTRGIPQVYYGTELAMAGNDQLRGDFPGGWKEDPANAFTREGRTAVQNECWDFASRLLNWRRTSKPVTEGRLVHYTPDNRTKCYVYARTDGKETVLVMLNGSDAESQVDMARFAEVVGDRTLGIDVVTGEVLDLKKEVHVAPRGVYVLELQEAPEPSVPAPPFAVYSEGMIDSIQPEGWLKEMLERQRDGLTGHPEAMAYPYNSVLWAGTLERDSESRGADWWRFEQTAYYLDGLTRLGFLLDDRHFLDVWQENIDYVLAHPLPFKAGQTAQEDRRPQRDFNAEVSADPRARERAAQMRERRERMQCIAAEDRPAGRLGPETGSMAWPWAVFFRAVQAYYEATGDPRIPAALEKNYLSYPVEELGMNRFVVNVEGMLWTYALTGNRELLDRAIAAWEAGASELTQANALDDSEFRMHGVTMNELLKVPLILYSHTGDKKYLDAALHAERKMEGPNMLVDGINSSTEALAGNEPLASHETCDVSDYTWTMGYYLMVTGDGQWADRIEKGVFNGGLGSITKDFKSMQYFSCPNQVIATGNSNHNRFKYGLTWMAYRPIHETECCIGNVHRFLPNYVARMWLRDRKGHPVAALYGPSSVEYDLGEGIAVRIEEETGYPFDEQIRFSFTFLKDGKVTDKPVRMDFTYRIPGWCEAGEPGFKTVGKTWKTGEVLTVDLPMSVEIVDNPVMGTSVVRGPVVYAFPVPAKVKEDPKVYDNLAGKVSANPDFKSWSMTPAGKWNYALVRNGLDGLRAEATGSGGFPFDPETVPLKIRVPVTGVRGWALQEDRFTPTLPENPESEGSVEYIDLVPYGSTTLRLTVFPVVDR